MTNFDFLKNDKQFESFADVAIAAENLLNKDIDACVFNCRRAMEFAVKWMYSVDRDLVMPYQDTLQVLMDDTKFKDIVGYDIWKRMDYVRKLGNTVAHGTKKIKREQVELCLENLYYFLDEVAYFYAEEYTESKFDSSLLADNSEEVDAHIADLEIDLKKLIDENKALKDELTVRRNEQQQTYVAKPLEISEYKTRKLYIDFMLQDAGWIEGKDWLNEVELHGMPNNSGVGYADYVLYGDDGKPLAVLEAKRTCYDVSKGSQQAKLYADILEEKYGRRPIIFLSNGFETHIVDNDYQERKVASVFSKRDLEKIFNLRTLRTSLSHVNVDKKIAGRYYQEAAIKAVCSALDDEHRRKALLVMATGSGKTRTVIALCDILLQHGWVKNILFLADRTSLVTQAKRSFVNLLPDLSVTNLCDDKDNYNAHCVFSTYQTMMNVIDDAKDEKGKIYTCGHFDLVICDEAHRSIYNKYKDIFDYFDCYLVGLTATPKSDIDKNTYEIFELTDGVPTYGYELAQAVKDGFLVDYMYADTQVKFLEQGIVYEDLSDEDKRQYEETFADEDGNIPEKIESSALNEWLFNEDTIKEVLNVVMTKGLRIDYGEKIGKTIIFAKNHNHAQKICEVFNKEYPKLVGYAKVIDNYVNYAQSAIDEFSSTNKLPQIAISVDMLDTGIDIPEILNLVFFKKVMSKAKFWQMIGRGTRLCPDLIDGDDKKLFYIFDLCGNFNFFSVHKDGKSVSEVSSLQGAIFHRKAQIVFKLQDAKYQTEEILKFRDSLIDDMVNKVQALNKKNFAVRQHIKYVELFSNPDNYKTLSYEDTLNIKKELAPLILPDEDEIQAVRFDALVYGLELAYITGNQYARYKSDLNKKVLSLEKIKLNYPEITAKSELIEKILHTDFLDDAQLSDFENIRQSLRDLIKFLPFDGTPIYNTNFTDEIMSVDWNESDLENDDLKDYKAKAEFYIRQHQDNIVIAKLRTNQPLTSTDISELERILWSEVGTKNDYENQYGQKPLGELVREIVGLDMNSAKEAFSEYLNDVNLNSRQIYFVNRIIEYIVHNGVLKDYSVFREPPFTDKGSLTDIFADRALWNGICKVIEQINANAVAG